MVVLLLVVVCIGGIAYVCVLFRKLVNILLLLILGSEALSLQDTGNILLLYCYEEKKATN